MSTDSTSAPPMRRHKVLTVVPRSALCWETWVIMVGNQASAIRARASLGRSVHSVGSISHRSKTWELICLARKAGRPRSLTAWTRWSSVRSIQCLRGIRRAGDLTTTGRCFPGSAKGVSGRARPSRDVVGRASWVMEPSSSSTPDVATGQERQRHHTGDRTSWCCSYLVTCVAGERR